MRSTTALMLTAGATGGAATILGAYGASHFALRGWATIGALASLGGATLALLGSRWYQQSITDDGTSLPNRRYLFAQLHHELRRATQLNRSLSFLVAEVDNMRTYNNSYGHLFGDKVLLSVAHTLRDSVRRGDIVARWGGDEFGIILPNTDLASATAIAERLRANVGDLAVNTGLGHTVAITISVGVAATAGRFGSVEDFVAAADAAMYHAKQHKNYVSVTP